MEIAQEELAQKELAQESACVDREREFAEVLAASRRETRGKILCGGRVECGTLSIVVQSKPFRQFG
jgi:hypothetical protein